MRIYAYLQISQTQPPEIVFKKVSALFKFNRKREISAVDFRPYSAVVKMFAVSDIRNRIFLDGNIDGEVPRRLFAEIVHDEYTVAFVARKSIRLVGKFNSVSSRHLRKSFKPEKRVLHFH